MSGQETRAKIMSEDETALKHLLRQAAKRSRPSKMFSAVPHGRETDANREFASRRDGDEVVWFFGSLPLFVIVYVIYVRMGAI